MEQYSKNNLFSSLVVLVLLSPCFGSESVTTYEVKPPSCGVVKVSKVSKIVGGTTANEFYPWFVSLVKRDSLDQKEYTVLCAAALITSKHALTAAHCYVGKSTPYKDTFAVMVDLVDRCSDTKGGKILETEKVEIHKDYHEYRHHVTNDIALIYLKEEAPNMPICLPSRGRYTGKMGVVTGFGSTVVKSSTYPCKIRYAEVEIISSLKCKKIQDTPVAEKTICAGFINGGIDTCDGDSGGPLMVNNKGTYELIGIVSYGNGCGRKNHPGLYTDVTKRGFLEWVMKRIKPKGSASEEDESTESENPPGDASPSSPQPQRPTLEGPPFFTDVNFHTEYVPLTPPPRPRPPRPSPSFPIGGPRPPPRPRPHSPHPRFHPPIPPVSMPWSSTMTSSHFPPLPRPHRPPRPRPWMMDHEELMMGSPGMMSDLPGMMMDSPGMMMDSPGMMMDSPGMMMDSPGMMFGSSVPPMMMGPDGIMANGFPRDNLEGELQHQLHLNSIANVEREERRRRRQRREQLYHM